MKEVLTIVLTVLGGLGVFLLGMKHLSEGLQAAAGQSLRRIMAMATSNRFAGIGTGVVSTMLVQSSSIVTVMLVGFVSAAIMTLPQAINVLIGANIGTTATVWIIAYAPNPQLLGLVGLALGGIMYFFFRREKVHHIGLTLMGLGLVFLGLYFMSKGVQPIRENPEIANIFTVMNAGSPEGVLLVAFLSMLLTAVIQSSAATIAIAMALATNGLISYEVAIAVLFGANIGTTATGWIAAIGSTADAKRTALSHTLSNLLGSLVFIWFFPLFVKFGQTLFPDYGTPVKVTVSGKEVLQYVHMMAPIAVTDTLFAVCRGVLLLPFVNRFAKLIEWLVKQPENEKPHLSALRLGAKVSPVLACDQALVEIDFMKKSDLELLDCARKVIAGETEDDDGPEKHIVHREDILDNVQREVTEFLGSIMSKRLAIDVSERAVRPGHLVAELHERRRQRAHPHAADANQMSLRHKLSLAARQRLRAIEIVGADALVGIDDVKFAEDADGRARILRSDPPELNAARRPDVFVDVGRRLLKRREIERNARRPDERCHRRRVLRALAVDAEDERDRLL